jgi:anti-anti-sigma factor
VELLVSTRVLPGCAVVEVQGEVDISTEPELRSHLAAVIATEPARLVVDLTGVEFLDSTGLGLLVWAYKKLEQVGGRFCLACPQPPVVKLLTMTSLNRLIEVHDTMAAATAGRDVD